MKWPRYYVDTSVIGGCYDEPFAAQTTALIDIARRGELVLLISDLLLEELARAPQAVREVLPSIPQANRELIIASDESIRLRDAYLAAKVVGPSSLADAHHVALASIAKADLIVSWNFKHIVHVDKIRGFQSVNLKLGYGIIDIRSPLEVVP
jgi:predicted nucleic acid-binding protein